MVSCTHPPSALRILFESQDYITDDVFAVALCERCRRHVTTPVPKVEVFDRYYPDTYYGPIARERFPFVVEYCLKRLYAHRARVIEHIHNKQKGRILDIGCGRGRLLHAFLARGWEVMGTEMNERAAIYAKDKLGIPMRIGELADLHLPENHFDVIMLWHVLEHVSDPQTLLAEIHRILQPGGILVIGVPNFGSFEARVSRGKWFALDVPRHLTHWRSDTLNKALLQRGFCIIRHSFFTAEYDFFGMVQSTLNLLGFRKNLLYNFLRSGEAKVLPGKRAKFSELLPCLALAIPLLVLSIPVTLLLSLLHNGATMTVFAKKEDSVTHSYR